MRMRLCFLRRSTFLKATINVIHSHSSEEEAHILALCPVSSDDIDTTIDDHVEAVRGSM